MANTKRDIKLRSINTHFWDDAYITNLDPIEKLLFLYFLTNSLTNLAGVYEIPLRRVAFDTGIDKDMVEKIIQRFQKDGKIKYDKETAYLIINNFRQHQKYNLSMETNVKKTLENLPNSIKEQLGYSLPPKCVQVEVEVEDKVEDKEDIKEVVELLKNALPPEKHPLQLFIKNNCPNIQKLKVQLSTDEAKRLLEDYSQSEIDKILKSMENYKPLPTKNLSVNLTMRNWLEREREKQSGNKKQKFNSPIMRELYGI